MLLSPGGGLRELQALAAGRFGLAESSGFELLDSSGAAVLSDDQLSLVIAGSAPMLSIRARESALLDLERAHDEAGLRRWALVQEVIAGLRVQLAQASQGISQADRRTAELEERLLHERKAREATIAAQQAEVQAMVERASRDLQILRSDFGTQLSQALDSLANRQREELKSCQDEAQEALKEEVAKLREELKEKERVRRQEGDDHNQHALQQAMERAESVELHAREAVQRAEAQAEARLDQARSELEERFRVLQQESESGQQSLRELVGKLDQKADDGLSDLTKRLEAQQACAESAVKDALQDFGSRCRELADKQADFQAKVEKSAAAEREQLQSCVDDRHRQCLEDIQGLRSQVTFEFCSKAQQDESTAALEGKFGQEIERAIEELRQDRKETDSRHWTHIDSMNSKLNTIQELQQRQDKFEEEASRRAADVDQRLARDQQEREKARADDAARRRDIEELRRLVADMPKDAEQRYRQLLADALSDAKGLVQESSASTLRCLQDKVDESERRLREDLKEKVVLIDQQLSSKAAVRALEELRADSERQVKDVAKDFSLAMTPALDAQVAQVEALANRQQLLAAEIQTGLANEGRERQELIQRMCATECDVGKVKQHLPILFAPVRGFR